MLSSRLHVVVALVLASNYLAFQAEIFDDEYEANHPTAFDVVSFSNPALNWESFDKENAPEAFVFDACIRLEFLFLFPAQPVGELQPYLQYQPIHDKSPPTA